VARHSTARAMVAATGDRAASAAWSTPSWATSEATQSQRWAGLRSVATSASKPTSSCHATSNPPPTKNNPLPTSTRA
jgi:hypothetical protein